jgi:hypothetical protein
MPLKELNQVMPQVLSGNIAALANFIHKNAIADKSNIAEDLEVILKLNVHPRMKVFLLYQYARMLAQKGTIKPETWTDVETISIEALNFPNLTEKKETKEYQTFNTNRVKGSFEDIKKVITKYIPDPNLKSAVSQSKDPNTLYSVMITSKQPNIPEFAISLSQVLLGPQFSSQFQMWAENESDLGRAQNKNAIKKINEKLDELAGIKEKAEQVIKEKQKPIGPAKPTTAFDASLYDLERGRMLL